MKSSLVQRGFTTALSAVCLLASGLVRAADSIGVVGLFPGKAVLIVNGNAPKTYSTGAKIGEGARLVAVGEVDATIEIGGRRERIAIGSQSAKPASSNQPAKISLTADERGHFMVAGMINGGSMQMLVDTGATMIALPARDASRLGIDYRKGQIGLVNTANGVATVYRVRLDTVRIGDIEVHQVDAVIQENGLNIGLLGMSFLNRTVMQRDGETMTLTKRF